MPRTMSELKMSFNAHHATCVLIQRTLDDLQKSPEFSKATTSSLNKNNNIDASFRQQEMVELFNASNCSF